MPNEMQELTELCMAAVKAMAEIATLLISIIIMILAGIISALSWCIGHPIWTIIIVIGIFMFIGMGVGENEGRNYRSNIPPRPTPRNLPPLRLRTHRDVNERIPSAEEVLRQRERRL